MPKRLLSVTNPTEAAFAVRETVAGHRLGALGGGGGYLPLFQRIPRGGGGGTGPWCWLVCLWRRLLASGPATFRPPVGPDVSWSCQRSPRMTCLVGLLRGSAVPETGCCCLLRARGGGGGFARACAAPPARSMNRSGGGGGGRDCGGIAEMAHGMRCSAQACGGTRQWHGAGAGGPGEGAALCDGAGEGGRGAAAHPGAWAVGPCQRVTVHRRDSGVK